MSGFPDSEISAFPGCTHIAEVLPQSMYLVDDAGRMVRWSPWFRDRIVGLSDTEMASIDFLELIHPEDRGLVRQRMRKILDLGVQDSLEVRIYLKGGPAFRWFLLMANRYEHDGSSFITGTGIDITRLKKAGMAMMLGEQRYRSMFEQADAPVFITDTEGAIVYVSPAFEKMTGYSFAECEARPFDQFCDETAPGGMTLSMFSEVISSASTIRASEITIRKKDGSSCYVELKLQRYHDNRTDGAIGVLYDLTERKRLESLTEFRLGLLQQAETASIEEILQKALDEAETLTDSQFGFICFLSEDAVSNSGCIWSSRVRDKMRAMSDHGVHHPFDVKPFLKKTLDSGRAAIVNEYPDMGHADFPSRHPGIFSSLSVPIIEQSKVVAVLLVFNKRSPYNNNDAQWAGTLADLVWDIVVRKRAAQAEMRNQSILLQIQKLELIGQLAGGIAHDFNNMLGVILGNAELALSSDDLDASVKENLQEIYQAAERSAEMTSQLLAFARKQTTMPRVIDVDETIRESLPILQRVAGEKIVIDWKPGCEECKLHIDPSQLDQILMNLCLNARDAMHGAGKIVLETKRHKIGASQNGGANFMPPGNYLQLSVTDTGQGIADTHKPHIFEPFFTTKVLGKGTGLGLSSVYGIVKQNRGFVDFESEEGNGSTFRIYLPLRKKRDAFGSGNETMNDEEGQTTILVVEDEPEILNLCRMMLEKSGFTVYAAACPSEAIVLAKENSGKIDLLLTDVVMPEMNGTDLSSKLLAISPGFRVLFMSGYSADVVAGHGVENPLVNVIRKPFTFKALAEKVRETLEVE
ncbi:histidine kinase [Chlorobaculum limnaeum]|uniref:histidine kinase n=1 Tax=Chlorobaculum limnaeum TaxID=274537 RepID=A0A1D8CWR5_CHLLM|nr:PAS domain S-box protein [Chlorobaculum limnaeum]AOS83340.1 histidine kinase [Chlorobaculum limnaeum]